VAHAHVPRDFGRAFAVGVALNVGIVLLQAVYGVVANSMALLADAGHNLSDVAGLLMAWGASVLVRRAPTQRFTWGLGGSSILAALANAIFLLVASGAIAWEAVQRLHAPEPVAGLPVMIVAGLGIVINGFTAWLFAAGRSDDINIRGAFLHMASDAAISLGVVVAGAATMLTGWLWLDPAASLVIVALIVWSTWGLLRSSAAMAMHAVPPRIDVAAVRDFLRARPGVARVHDLHIWPTSTTETALTCHLVMPGGHPGDAFTLATAAALKERFRIGHSTIQIEVSEDTECTLAPDHVV
jgi:cobalt-zinc-cadmium efflux system protein